MRLEKVMEPRMDTDPRGVRAKAAKGAKTAKEWEATAGLRLVHAIPGVVKSV